MINTICVIHGSIQTGSENSLRCLPFMLFLNYGGPQEEAGLHLSNVKFCLFVIWILRLMWWRLVVSPCRLRDTSSHLSWRESSFLTTMSQNQSAQTPDYVSQDVFNQLFEMLDQWVNTAVNGNTYCTLNRLKFIPQYYLIVVFQIGGSFGPAHRAELQRRSGWRVSRKHHPDQYGLYHHARAGPDARCE